MRFRKLRIAWSVAFLIACVLLIVLWVRSYFAVDNLMLTVRNKGWVSFTSRNASLGILLVVAKMPTLASGLRFNAMPPDTPSQITWREFAGFGYHFSTDDEIYAARAPCWFLILIAGIMSAIAVRGFKWRFSFRTLLIATTLIAVVLGAIVYAVR